MKNIIDPNEDEINIPFSTQEIQVQKEKRILTAKKINYLFIIISSLIYISSIIYGITKLSDSSFSSSQATLIILQSFGGLLIAFSYPIAEKLFKVKLSFYIRFGISLFAFLGIILGETFQFYYHVQYWDKFLHFTSGVGITFIGYCILANLFKNNSMSHKMLFLILGSLLISFSIAYFWEIYEFTCDSIAGTNMQKFMPENYLFNGGNTFAPLGGTDQEIADFYKYPSGYRFALNDTMGDMISCFFGSMLFICLSSILNKLAHKNIFTNLIEFQIKGKEKLL